MEDELDRDELRTGVLTDELLPELEEVDRRIPDDEDRVVLLDDETLLRVEEERLEELDLMEDELDGDELRTGVLMDELLPELDGTDLRTVGEEDRTVRLDGEILFTDVEDRETDLWDAVRVWVEAYFLIVWFSVALDREETEDVLSLESVLVFEETALRFWAALFLIVCREVLSLEGVVVLRETEVSLSGAVIARLGEYRWIVREESPSLCDIVLSTEEALPPGKTS
jgi:hypothetical protein